jgi:hypothetical protein
MPVTHRRLGRHGVLVGNLCLGTMNFGPHADEWNPHGLTEQIIGRWFAQGGGRRDPGPARRDLPRTRRRSAERLRLVRRHAP